MRLPILVISSLLIVMVCVIAINCSGPASSDCGESWGYLEDPNHELFEQIHRRAQNAQSVHPHSQDRMFLELVSDSKLRVVYERDDQLYVETYEVTDQRETRYQSPY